MPQSSSFKARQSVRTKLVDHPRFYSIGLSLHRKYCSLTHFLHTLPDYLIIGAAKCGTSSLYEYLIQHPNIGQSLTKQIHYFDLYYDRHSSWYKVCFPFVWEKFFVEKLKNKKFVTGEATALYLIDSEAPKRAYKLIPNAKIIVMLRNPIERAYSHHQMEYRNGSEIYSFEDAIEKENERLKDDFDKVIKDPNYFIPENSVRSYLRAGIYLDQLKRWMKYFPKEQFLILKSEDFFENPDKIFNNTLNFLGVDSFHFEKYPIIREGKYNSMNSETRLKLKKFFEPYNKALYEYLGRNFGWE